MVGPRLGLPGNAGRGSSGGLCCIDWWGDARCSFCGVRCWLREVAPEQEGRPSSLPCCGLGTGAAEESGEFHSITGEWQNAGHASGMPSGLHSGSAEDPAKLAKGGEERVLGLHDAIACCGDDVVRAVLTDPLVASC